MGIEYLCKEDGFHLARQGTNWQQGLHNFAQFCTQLCTICFACQYYSFQTLEENLFVSQIFLLSAMPFKKL